MFGELLAERGEQVERQTRIGQLPQCLLRPVNIAQAPGVKLLRSLVRMIQDTDERGDFHAKNRSDQIGGSTKGAGECAAGRLPSS